MILRSAPPLRVARRDAHLSIMRHLFGGALLILTCCGKSADGPGPAPGSTTTIALSGGSIVAEIAATSGARETGLMGRAALGSGSGMLFIFPSDQVPILSSFWMKNTSIPLSIAFIDAALRVINLKDMAPFDTVNFATAAAPYRYALEVNQGWFAAHGVVAGTTVSFILPAGTVITP